MAPNWSSENESGGYSGALARLVNVAGRKAGEKGLRENEELLRTVVTNLPVILWVISKDGHFILSEGKALEEFDLKPGQIVGQSIAGIFPDSPEVIEAIFRGIQGEKFISKLAHDSRILEAWFSPLLDENNELAGTIAVLTDITERIKGEKELRETNDKLANWLNELERRNHEVMLLNEMSSQLQSCLTEEEAYRVIRKQFWQLFPSQTGALYLKTLTQTQARLVTRWNQIEKEQGFLNDPFNLLECLALQKKGTLISAQDQKEFNCNNEECKYPNGNLCVPLLDQKEALGTLHLEMPEGNLSDARLQLINMVAESVSLAITNIRLREKLREQSIRDPLTGLFNRRYMEETLEREMYRVKRSKKPLGVIMLDIDGFKVFNDQYGHNAGDILLVELSRLITTIFRSGDIPCRYGGDELVIILPEAPLEAVIQRAQQLRCDAENLKVQVQNHALAINISLGVAGFPENGTFGGQLLLAADEALYRAKSEGKNRVSVAAVASHR